LIMGILDKIKEIENEISRTQKNKATEYHLGLLKAKLAKYRAQLLEPQGKSAQKGEGFDVMKSGDARVALIGFPSVGKSTLLNKLTSTFSECANYEFTTLTCIPGVIAVARTADLVLIMLDAAKPDVHRSLLEYELESVGIRLNKRKPNIYFKQQKTGGLKFTHQVPLTHMNEKLVYTILHEYKIFNADIIFREDCTMDEFIDVISGNRVYLPCLYVYNKIDQISIEEVDRLAHQPHSVVVSCNVGLNLDYLLEMLWEYLDLICIYTKKRGERPNFSQGHELVMRNGCSVEDVAHRVHRSLVSQFKYALVWGSSVKFNPQRVGLTHRVQHQDVMQIVKK
uniref:TGS domain-containing protein n=1 Tax=Macrostomum lignano TaxID=282301 RepID=A0A1I8IRI6_9PLAT